MDVLSVLLDLWKSIFAIMVEYWGYHSGIYDNMITLKDDELGDLNNKKRVIQKLLHEQHIPGETVVRDDVESWLKSVEKIDDEIKAIEKKVTNVKYILRCFLGKVVLQKRQEVEKLQNRWSSFPERLVVSCPQHGHKLPTPTVSGLETFERKVQDIWACFDIVTKIGVSGMGGIGKTTALRCINKRILESGDKFDDVIWVTVSRGLVIKNLQDKIAGKLNLDISNSDDVDTAGKIRTRLEAKKRFVLILDDLWEHYALEKVGIPEPTLENGRKIIVTTRSRDVCRLMQLHEIQMELLSHKEATILFLHHIGHTISINPKLEATLTQIVQECACLPLAIVTIAKSLVGTDDPDEWTDALEDLKELKKESAPAKEIMEILKFSYDRLTDQKLQKCLLYCALYPEDYEIRREVLIEHLIAEGIIETQEKRQREIVKGQVMVNKLVKACLLINTVSSDGAKCIKMHDLIRDMALQIASESHGYLVKLKSIPDEDRWNEDLTKVSLINIHDIPPSSQPPKCPGLSTFFLTQSFDLKCIPDEFFCHMKRLSVLDLSFTGMVKLPKSISDLVTLTALFLRYCGNLKYLPSLAKLKRLRKLDFYQSGIQSIPEGLEMLVNLRYLNFDKCPLIDMPSGILCKLTNLQYLTLPHSHAGPEVKEDDLELLKKLETFEGVLYDVNSFNAYVGSSQEKVLTSYILQLGFCNSYVHYASFEDRNKIVYLTGNWQGSSSSTTSRGCSLLLPKDVNVLAIHHCHDSIISSLCDLTSVSEASQLTLCHVEDCEGIEHLFSYSYRNKFSLLPKLEILDLDGLKDLRGLIEIERSPRAASFSLPPHSFSSLKELRMCNCNSMKTLFLFEYALALPNLEQLALSSCEQLEAIVSADDEEISNHASNVITLPKLRRFFLSKLPKLQRLPVYADSLQDIHIDKCPELKRTDPLLDREQCPVSLMHVYIDQDSWGLLKWECQTAKDFVWSLMTLTHNPEEEEEEGEALFWRNLQEEEEGEALFKRPAEEEEATFGRYSEEEADSYWGNSEDEEEEEDDDGDDDVDDGDDDEEEEEDDDGDYDDDNNFDDGDDDKEEEEEGGEEGEE